MNKSFGYKSPEQLFVVEPFTHYLSLRVLAYQSCLRILLLLLLDNLGVTNLVGLLL